jgi:hypothetical protein
LGKSLRVRLLAAATVNGKRSYYKPALRSTGWPDPAAILVRDRKLNRTASPSPSKTAEGNPPPTPTTSSHQSQCWKRAEETVGTLDGETDVQGVVMWRDATAGIRWVRTCPRLIKHSPFLNWRIQYPISTRQFVQISSFALRTSCTSQLRLGLKLHSNGHRLWNYYCLIASPL